METENDVAIDIRALVADLLPVLAPHAMLDADSGRLVLPVGDAHADISLDAITAACAALPQQAWPGRVEAWLAAKAAQVTAALPAPCRPWSASCRARARTGSWSRCLASARCCSARSGPGKSTRRPARSWNVPVSASVLL
jgi:hypothetical protein